MSATPASPRFSFRGYSFVVWAIKNGEWIKATLAGVATAVAAGQWKIAAACGIALVCKWAADAIEYFASVQLD